MFGSKSKKPKTPDPQVVSDAQTKSNQQTAAYEASLGRQNTYTPYGSQTFTQNGTDPSTGAPRWDQNIALDPRVQANLDQQLAQDTELGSAQNDALARVRSAYQNPMDTSGAPALRDAPTMNSYQSQIDTNGLPQLYGADDLLGARTQTQDALYNKQAAYLDPQWQQREDRFRTRMNNNGVVEGSEAWKTALDDENRARTFEYDQARGSAIAGGGDEMSRLASIASGNRGQIFNERATQGDFTNKATGAGNADAIRSAGFGNDARAQSLAEQYRARAQPMNEFTSLRAAANPVELPQFENPNGTNVAPTNTSGNIWNAYQGELDMYNAGQSSNNAMFGGLANLGGQLGSAWISSDARIKSDITPAGSLPDGTRVYDYRKGGRPERGVLAQEVEQTHPNAVKTGADGIKKVNYRRLMAQAMAA